MFPAPPEHLHERCATSWARAVFALLSELLIGLRAAETAGEAEARVRLQVAWQLSFFACACAQLLLFPGGALWSSLGKEGCVFGLLPSRPDLCPKTCLFLHL